MWQTLGLTDVKRKQRTSIQHGLTNEEAGIRLKQYGENKLEDKKKEGIITKFIKQFNDFMIIILIFAALISAVITKIDGSNDYIDSIIIITIVVFNAIIGLMQEAKAEKSLEALKKMTAPVAKVKREGKILNVRGTEVVPGDIVILEAGNFVPADCRLIDAHNLKVEESSLTGETVPVLKDASVILKEDTSLGDMVNMVFATTVVVNGHGEGIVTETAMNTKVGKIAKMIITDEAPKTPIQKNLSQVGKTLGIGCLVICAFIFVIGLIKKNSVIEMFMTSVGLACAAIPEGLPAIVTIMLSIGVTKMAKKNSIIRKLPAVETLGCSTVICSDKTGTLTQNKMKVVEVQNIEGKITNVKEKDFILELGAMCTDAYINYDKGKEEIIGEPTEIAIVSAANDIGKNKLDLYKEKNRVNDIPFDSDRKMMTTIHKIGDKYRIITKGAPDVLLKRCTKFLNGDRIQELNNLNILKIEEKNSNMAKEGLRVLAVSYLDVDEIPKIIDSKQVENNLIFARINWND